MTLLESTLSLIGDFLVRFWWIFIPVLLLILFIDLYSFYKKEKKKREIKWTLLEIVPPKEIEKTPKAMEQVFAAVDEISEKNWASFEIIGRAGVTHFFVRIPEDFHNLVESAIYAQYPEAEINPVSEYESYIAQFPENLPDNTYDVWGTELTLGREDGYPIRTYPEFKEKSKEEEDVDPIAGITEIMSKLERSEAIWLQILIKPADDKEWNEKAEGLIDELMGKKKKEEGLLDWLGPWFHSAGEFFQNLFKGIFEPPEWADKEEKKEEEKKGGLTPGKQRAIEYIENKMSKIGFHGAIRFVYVDRRDKFTKSNISGVMGALRQFNTNNLNHLKENKKVKTKTKNLLKEKRLKSRKKRIFANYLTRDFPKKTSIFNTEELATLYHFPATNVKSPLLKRVSVRRGGPPPDLPVE